VHGDFRMLLPEHPAIYAFTRTLDGRSLLVVANLSDESVACELEGDELVLTNLPEAAASGEYAPWEARVYRSAGA
jgi:oligo-1,6-glucosidase